MLFAGAADVNRVWGIVARATVGGQLGVAAKVATERGGGAARLVCVYTGDFADRGDVGRVVEGLVGLGLVGGREVYYKCGECV